MTYLCLTCLSTAALWDVPRKTACCGIQDYAIWLSCPRYVAVERWIIE